MGVSFVDRTAQDRVNLHLSRSSGFMLPPSFLVHLCAFIAVMSWVLLVLHMHTVIASGFVFVD